MTTQNKKFAVVAVPELVWPSELEIPTKRFRLLVTADTSSLGVDSISDFVLKALEHGMVYFCSWGPGCERFRDIVDETVVENDIGERKFAGSKPSDVIMTTWHDKDSLEEALDFFANWALPTEGFQPDSDFHLVICIGNPDWAATANKFLKSFDFVR